MNTRITSWIAVLVVALGLPVMGGAMFNAASAHTGDLTAQVTCVNGQQHVVYKLKLANVPNGVTGSTKWRVGNTTFDGTPTSNTGMPNGPVASSGNQTITLGSEDYAGNYGGAGNWVYAYTTFSNGNKVGSDGRIDDFAGNCLTTVTVPVAPQKVDECNPEGVTSNIHWISVPASNNDYTVTGNSTSNLTFTLKPGRVWSDGTTAPKTFVLGNDNGVVCVTTVAIPVQPQKVDECNPEGIASNIHWLSVPPSTADYTVTGTSTTDLTFTLKSNRKWSDGTTAPKVFLLGNDNGTICVTTVVIPVAPQSTDECNPAGVTSNIHWLALPVSTNDYTVTGTLTSDITITLKPNRKWSDNTTAPKVFKLGADSTEPCKPPCDDECALPILPTNAPATTVCSGILHDVTLNNVVVQRGRSCTLVNVHVNGNVTGKVGAHDLVLGNVTVRGNVRATGLTGDFVFGATGSACRYDPKVGGSITVKNSHNVLICQAKVCYDVTVTNNDGQITIRTTQARKVTVKHNDRFVPDGKNVGHTAAEAIRLINVTAHNFVLKPNARRVETRNLHHI